MSDLHMIQGLRIAPDLPDLVLIEGDEEVQYVFIELPPSIAQSMLAPGAKLDLQGLDSDKPCLHLSDGTQLVGEYEEPLGSIMFFQSEIAPASGLPAGALYRGHTDSKLVFREGTPAIKGD